MKSAMNESATKIFSVAVVLCGCWLALAQQGQAPAAVTMAVAPSFPPAALALPKGDDAVVEVTISPKGEVESAKPMQGSRLLYAASLAAAKKWHFQATDQQSKVLLTFSFRLLPQDALSEDATVIFIPPYRVEIRKKMPSPTINYGQGR
jgi:hypothetical protein